MSSENRRQKHVIYHSQNIGTLEIEKATRKGSYHIRASKSRPRSRSPRSSCQPHSRTLPPESLLALRPSMRGLPHLLMQLRAAACTPSRSPSALSVPNSAVPRLRGLPIRKPVGCNYPSGGGRVAVNITSSRMVVASIKLGLVEKKRERERSSLFLEPVTQHEKSRPSLPCYNVPMTKPRKGEGSARR